MRIIKNILVGVVLIGVVVVGAYYNVSRYDRYGYIRSYDNGVYTITTISGDDWEWEADKDAFNIGDNVKLKMYSNLTDDIEDDIILKVIVRGK